MTVIELINFLDDILNDKTRNATVEFYKVTDGSSNMVKGELEFRSFSAEFSTGGKKSLIFTTKETK